MNNNIEKLYNYIINNDLIQIKNIINTNPELFNSVFY